MFKLFYRACFFVALFSVIPASNATIFNFSYTGLFTLLDSTGQFVINTDASANSTNGNRTDISGLLSFDDVTGAGTFSVDPFNLLGFGSLDVTNGQMQAIGDGLGGPSGLLLTNLLYDFNGTTGVPVSMVWDAAGFFNALNMGMVVGDQISGDDWISGATITSVGSALPASDNTVGPVVVGPGTTTYPIGPAPLAMTTWDVATVSGATFGTIPSGELPLIVDTVVDATNGDTGIGGSPMIVGDLVGFNFNLDIGDVGTMVLLSTEPSPVPLPAAVWLFGSGLLGLIGVAKRKSRA